MTAQQKPQSTITPSERRGSFSNFDSLLRLGEAYPADDALIAGTGDAVLYLRVSTQRQLRTAMDLDADGNSIATQREATSKRAKRLKAPVVKEFVEPGHSAQTIAKRPIFRDLLHYLEENPNVSYVIIYMRSRVFRNQTDAAITKRILANMGVKLISAKEEFGEGYMADAMEAITDIMNEVQVRQSGEDIKNKMLHKAKNGGTTGRAKLGYLNIRKDVDGHLVNSIGIDHMRAPLVTWAFEQYASGEYSLARLKQELADQGLTTRRTVKWDEKPVSRSQIARMLRDPYYLGMVTYKGQVFPGKHEALVKPEVFERVQHVLDVRMQRNQRDIVYNHFLRGMLHCGRCHAEGRDHQLIFARAQKPSGEAHEYFFCGGRRDDGCDLPYLPVQLVEEAMLRHIESLRLTGAEIEAMREQCETEAERQLRSGREAHARIAKELAALEVKEERLVDLVADGAMPVEKVRERLNKIQVQKAALTQRSTDSGEFVRQESELISNYLRLVEQPGVFYANANDNVKRRLVAAYFWRIWVDDDGHKINIEAESQEIVGRLLRAASSSTLQKRGTELLFGAPDSPEPTRSNFGVGSTKTNLVRAAGVEPARVSPTEFKSAASAIPPRPQ